MAIDQSKVGIVAAGLMEILESAYGDDAGITSVFLIAAVDHDDGSKTTVHYNVSPGMPVHEGLGLLQYIQNALARQET